MSSRNKFVVATLVFDDINFKEQQVPGETKTVVNAERERDVV